MQLCGEGRNADHVLGIAASAIMREIAFFTMQGHPIPASRSTCPIGGTDRITSSVSVWEDKSEFGSGAAAFQKPDHEEHHTSC